MLVSIVVPAHNEEENLPLLAERLVQMLRRSRLPAEVILVDDNSTDSTPQVCDRIAKKHPLVRALHRRGERGMGNALKEGTLAARGSIVIWTMADLSDDVEAIPRFVEEIRDGADMVFGSRYMEGGSPGDLSRVKAFSSKAVSLLAAVGIGIPVRDITNAFRGFRKEVFHAARPRAGDFAISPEFALKAHLRGFRLGEVPVTYKNRVKGVQKFRMYRMGKRYARILAQACLARAGLVDF